MNDADLHRRGSIFGYILLGALHHKQYGVATYLKPNYRQQLGKCYISQRRAGDAFNLLVEVDGIELSNVYKKQKNTVLQPST